MAYGQFFRITGAFIIGVVSLVIALVIFGLFLPFMLAFFAVLFPFITGAMLILAAVVVLWLVVYFIAMIGAGVYYAIMKPAEVSRDGKAAYGIEGVEEAGLREKGRSERKPARHAARKRPAKKRKAAKRKQRK